MADEKKPFTYAADLFLNATKNLGELTDSLLDGKVTQKDLEKWGEVEKVLGEMKVELIGAYIISGSASDDFFSRIRSSISD